MQCRKCSSELSVVVITDAYGSEQNMLVCLACRLDSRDANKAQLEPHMEYREQQSYRVQVWNILNGVKEISHEEAVHQEHDEIRPLLPNGSHLGSMGSQQSGYGLELAVQSSCA